MPDSPEFAAAGQARSRVADLLLLTAVCAVTFFAGLTTHGLSNWHESQRALVAQDMQRHGAWLVPSINGRPYLAKPPLFYWVQLGLARLQGAAHPTGEFELRLAVALAGLAGVLATYSLARGLLAGLPAARESSLWSSLFLATAPLYIRSSRIGEIDIWLVPFVVVAIAGIARARRRSPGRRPIDYAALALATLAATGAALTKGPPGLALIALGGYGPIVLAAVLSPNLPVSRAWRSIPRVLAAAAGLAGLALAARQVDEPRDLPGVPLIALVSAGAAWLIGAAAAPARLRTILADLSRTHPLMVLGMPVLALAAWARLVAARIGPTAAAFWAQRETDDNLRIFNPESPLRNLEAMSFAVGVGGFVAAATLLWIVWRRPRLPACWLTPLAWLGLGFAVFTLFGRGNGRYQTPVWPALAMLGGMGAGRFLHRDPDAPRKRAVLGLAVLLSALAAGAWYGWGREAAGAHRSPRAMVTELRERGLLTGRLAAFELSNPAIDVYAAARAQPVGKIDVPDALAGGAPWTIDELADDLGGGGPRVIFMRGRTRPGEGGRTPIERLRAAGFTLEPLNLEAHYSTDSGKSDVVVARIWLENEHEHKDREAGQRLSSPKQSEN